jgi:3',5'-cyclic-AMP phosphodiesterase
MEHWTEETEVLVAQISDSHLYADANRALLDPQGNPVCVPETTLLMVLDHVGRLESRPDLLLLTGDLSDDGSAESYQRLDRNLAGLGIPYHWIPGNHDSPGRMAMDLTGNSSHFSFRGWHFGLLSSKALPEGRDDGEVSAATLEELDRFLRAHLGPTLLAVHHPPLEIGSPWLDDCYPLRNASVLRQMISNFPQVKVVVSGHAHQFFSQQRRGILYLGTASTSSQLVPRSDSARLVGTPPDYRDAVPGYRLLMLKADGSIETQAIWVE